MLKLRPPRATRPSEKSSRGGGGIYAVRVLEEEKKVREVPLGPPAGADPGHVRKSSAAEALAALPDPQIYSNGKWLLAASTRKPAGDAARKSISRKTMTDKTDTAKFVA